MILLENKITFDQIFKFNTSYLANEFCMYTHTLMAYISIGRLQDKDDFRSC